MSVSIPHTAYQAMLPLWEAYRTASIGEAAVKGARDFTRASRGLYAPGTRYLPRPAGMKREDQYAAYRDRPSWIGATERAVQGITGSIFRHEPQLEVPAALEPQIADITQTGVDLRALAEGVVSEDLLMGRYGILVDYPQAGVAPDDGVFLAPVDQRPYWIPYQAEEIINWRTVRHQGKTILSLVVLKECVPVVQGAWGSDDFFLTQDRIQYRVLRLDESGRYEVSVWIEDPGQVGRAQRRATLAQVWIPTRQGIALDFIPFKFVGSFTTEPSIQKSLLDGLIHRNFLCWRHSADKEHGLHLTAMPQMYVAADMDTPPELYVGASQALFLPKGSTAGIVEFHGHGLQPHENAIKEDLEIMAMMGARLLEPPPRTAETATAVQWRMAGQDSPVQRLVGTCSQALTWALQVHAWWGGFTENVDDPAIGVVLNKDLVSTIMEPQMLQALMQALLNGTISYETFFFNLQRGEIARPLVDVEEERALIEDAMAQRPLVTVAPGPSTPPPGRNGAARAVA